jgi:hypothetical protein
VIWVDFGLGFGAAINVSKTAVATRGKKTLSSAPHPKHRSVAGSSRGATVPLCMGGAEVRGFSRSARKNLLLKPEYPGAV